MYFNPEKEVDYIIRPLSITLHIFSSDCQVDSFAHGMCKNRFRFGNTKQQLKDIQGHRNADDTSFLCDDEYS